jgi:hypothetical protein
MWVRYPNGQVIQYNTANHFVHTDAGDWQLLTRENGSLVARIQASSGCIVEFEKACSVENPINGMTPNNVYSFLIDNYQSLKGWQAKDLKRLFARFNIKTYNWKK